MADEADFANEQIEIQTAAAIRQATAIRIPVGEPGECNACGEDMPRLVNGRCAPCRDGRRRVL